MPRPTSPVVLALTLFLGCLPMLLGLLSGPGSQILPEAASPAPAPAVGPADLIPLPARLMETTRRLLRERLSSCAIPGLEAPVFDPQERWWYTTCRLTGPTRTIGSETLLFRFQPSPARIPRLEFFWQGEPVADGSSAQCSGRLLPLDRAGRRAVFLCTWLRNGRPLWHLSRDVGLEVASPPLLPAPGPVLYRVAGVPLPRTLACSSLEESALDRRHPF